MFNFINCKMSSIVDICRLKTSYLRECIDQGHPV